MALNIEKMKQAKKEKGLSYDDLARLTGYSRSTITNIFCGYIELPRHETILALEEALGLRQSNLEWTNEDKEIGTIPKYKETLTEEEIEILDAYRAIKSEKGDATAHAIKTLLTSYLDKK